ncbi:MAG: phosphoglucosamine mutase, partial [Thermoplasmata archaeon]
MSRFGSSGIRGLANIDVTPQLALRVGMVIGELYGDTVIGRDPRLTGPMLDHALSAGVVSSGATAWDAGLVSTPTLARGARDCDCGVVITASHNPAPYNGIKLWNPDGMAFDENQQREIEDALDQDRFSPPAWDRIGSMLSRPDLIQEHVEAILK